MDDFHYDATAHAATAGTPSLHRDGGDAVVTVNGGTPTPRRNGADAVVTINKEQLCRICCH